MIIKKTFPSVPVDAGVICVADHKWLRRQGAIGAGADIELRKGIYYVTLLVQTITPVFWREYVHFSAD